MNFHHFTDKFTRAALEADPRKLSPESIEKLVMATLLAAETDMDNPDVHNAGHRMEIAEAAMEERDPVRAHGLACRFWSI